VIKLRYHYRKEMLTDHYASLNVIPSFKFSECMDMCIETYAFFAKELTHGFIILKNYAILSSN
jgi:hypothetical protein